MSVLEPLKDIDTREDIIRMVDTFYESVKSDDLLAPVFSHVDWPKHLPTMYNFWSSIVFGDQAYTGNPFSKHIGLPIRRVHFIQWLALFNETVDVLFSGPRASEVKQRAQSIAGIFQHKLGLLEK